MPLYRILVRTPHLYFDWLIEGESYEEAVRSFQECIRKANSEIVPLKPGDPYIHFVIVATDETEHFVELCSLDTQTEYGTYNPDRVTCPHCIKLMSALTADTKVLHFHSRS
jgi:hypothetical protein